MRYFCLLQLTGKRIMIMTKVIFMKGCQYIPPQNGREIGRVRNYVADNAWESATRMRTMVLTAPALWYQGSAHSFWFYPGPEKKLMPSRPFLWDGRTQDVTLMSSFIFS